MVATKKHPGHNADGTFAEGNRVNPGGRPKRRKITDTLKAELEAVCPWDPEQRTYREVVAESILNQAAEGNLYAIREILDRTEGKPHQSSSVAVDLEVSGELVAKQMQYEELREAERLMRAAHARALLEANREN